MIHPETLLVDSHCHLDFPELSSQLPTVLANMAEHEVTHALCISVTLPDYPRVLAVAEAYPNIWASVGVHPDYQDTEEPSVARLLELAQHPKVIAIGETGLDYYRVQGEPLWQQERFRRHIQAARECGKPLIIHTRSAADDTLRILREENAAPIGGVMHCFTESLQFAEHAMAMNFYISFSGIVTFKNARELKEVARRIPLERMLIETDSPYLAPVPHRGKLNQPAYVKYVAEEIATLRGQSFDDIARATRDNFFRLFRNATPQ